MEYVLGGGIKQKLALEKRLLEEEKYIVQTLKKIKQECHGLQIERMHLISLLDQVQNKGKRAQAKTTKSTVSQQSPSSEPSPLQGPVEYSFQPESEEPRLQSLAEEFNIQTLDGVGHHDVELNLTVPQHPFFETEAEEEFEEIENDDYEIEIGMLMNGKHGQS